MSLKSSSIDFQLFQEIEPIKKLELIMQCHPRDSNTLSTVTTVTFLKFENISNFRNEIVSYNLGQFIFAPPNFRKFHRNKFGPCFILLNLCKVCTNSCL